MCTSLKLAKLNHQCLQTSVPVPVRTCSFGRCWIKLQLGRSKECGLGTGNFRARRFVGGPVAEEGVPWGSKAQVSDLDCASLAGWTSAGLLPLQPFLMSSVMWTEMKLTREVVIWSKCFWIIIFCILLEVFVVACRNVRCMVTEVRAFISKFYF